MILPIRQLSVVSNGMILISLISSLKKSPLRLSIVMSHDGIGAEESGIIVASGTSLMIVVSLLQ